MTAEKTLPARFQRFFSMHNCEHEGKVVFCFFFGVCVHLNTRKDIYCILYNDVGFNIIAKAQ